MFALKPNILFIGVNKIPKLDLAIGVFDHSVEVPYQEDSQYDVICTTLQETKIPHFKLVFDKIKKASPQIQILLTVQNRDSLKDTQKACENFPIFKIIDPKNVDQLESDLLFALEEAQHVKQEIQLENLVVEQNNKLKSLYQELEDRVSKRQGFLLEARRKTHIANARWESLKEAMIAIYKSSNISEMETNLLACLGPTLHLGGIRIVLKPQDTQLIQQLRSQKSLTFFSTPISKSEDNFGTLIFIRKVDLLFQKDETDFLARVSEAVSLAVDRQSKLEESLTLKEQWEATFNSVSEPVSLINENYEVVQTNSAYLKASGLPKELAAGQKCYRILFQRSQPCQNCQLGKNFRLDMALTKQSERSLFDVYSQQVPVDPIKTTVFVNLYQDVTEQTQMERKILDSARLAEIGTIGSSIAHELNNPLGGILSFVQLIKMDLPQDHSFYEDIQSMEEGVLRCRDIVQNLLNFTRNPLVDEESSLDLKDVIHRTIKIVELQTRSRGIDVRLNLSSGDHPFRGHLNLLSQAFRNLLQVSIDSIIDHSRTHRGFQGVIEVREESKDNEYCFKILDNGLATDQSPHLGLSIARQIFHDYGGKLEISQKQQPFKWVQISLPRPVFPA